MMYTLPGVVIALAEVLLPFMVLALDAALLNIDPQSTRPPTISGPDASGSFFEITLPLSLPGVISGSSWSSPWRSAPSSRRAWSAARG